MSSAFCSKSYRCKNENWCAKDYNPEPYDYECFEPMTNADKLRQMTDEELAEFMEGLSPSKKWSIFLDGKRWLDWLKQEVSDD